MPLTRLQATGRVSVANATSISLTFATPPAVGSGVVVLISNWGGGVPGATGTDNRGQTYTRAIWQASGSFMAAIYVCPRVTVSAAPFTITLTYSLPGYFEAAAVEIGGVGTGLTVDQVVGAAPTGLTVSTGTTPALTASEVLVAAVLAIGANQSAITVVAVSPVWLQEYENLSYSTTVAGEGDTRVLTGAAGTTQSCSWTLGTSTSVAAALAAFTGSAPPAVETARPYVVLPA